MLFDPRTGQTTPFANPDGGREGMVYNDGKLDLVRAGGVSINTTFGPRGGFISDPTLTGGGDPRAVVRFFENGKQIGSTAANTSGTWTFKPVLADGKHTIVVDTTLRALRPGSPADIVLSVDGSEVARTVAKITVPGAFTASETFDVGTDLGSPVSAFYDDLRPFAFVGKIHLITVALKQ